MKLPYSVHASYQRDVLSDSAYRENVEHYFRKNDVHSDPVMRCLVVTCKRLLHIRNVVHENECDKYGYDKKIKPRRLQLESHFLVEKYCYDRQNSHNDVQKKKRNGISVGKKHRVSLLPDTQNSELQWIGVLKSGESDKEKHARNGCHEKKIN